MPLIGGSAFDDLAAQLRGMRTSVIGEKTSDVFEGAGNPLEGQFMYQAGSIGRWLQDQIVIENDNVFESILELLRQSLFNGLKGINSDLFSFVVPDLDDADELQFDANGKIITRLVEKAEDIQLIFVPEQGLLTFNLMFGGVLVGEKQADGTVAPAALPIDFSAGIPGVNLEVDADLNATIDYLMGLGLGLGGVGVFLDTSGINEDGEEIALDIDAGLAPGSTAEGTLGFLKMNFVDVNPDGSGIHGHLGLDIRDEDNDGIWAPLLGEGVDVGIAASAFVDADISASVATSAGDYLPSVSTIIRYDQILGDVEISTDGGARFDMGSPQVVLEDVTLNVGSVFDSFLGDTLSTIADIITPLKPLVKLLTTDIDLGITTLQFIDIAYLKLPAKTVEQAKSVLNVLDNTIDFLEKIDAMSTAGGINFGTFNLTESSLENPDAPTSEDDVATSKRDDSKLTQEQKDTLKGPNQEGLDNRPASSSNGSNAPAGSSTSGRNDTTKRALPSEKRFSIPLLEDPASLIDFILDRAPVDLFYYDLPDLNLFFEYSKTYPVYPGLNAGLFGEIGASTNFDFGYDTRGLSAWMETDFDINQVGLIFDGFYLDDHGFENTPGDEAEAVVIAAVGAIASVGIPGLVEAGVKGGIEAEIEFDLNDRLTDFSGGEPIGDGKLYGRELIQRLSQGPECLFDMQGTLSVFLEAFFWVGLDLGFSEITIYEASSRFVDEIIAEFSFECLLDRPEDLAVLDSTSGELLLRYLGGEDAGAHNYFVSSDVANASLTVEEAVGRGYIDPEYYSATELDDLEVYFSDLATAHADEDLIVVSTGSRAEFFLAADVSSIKARGTGMSDRFALRGLNGLVADIDISTGEGNDVIEITSNASLDTLGTLLIDAGTGDDYILVDPGLLGAAPADSYVIRGNGGSDRIKIAKSGNEDAATSTVLYSYTGLVLDGGSGDDSIFGNSGVDIVDGGSGDDVILTYGGNDEIHAGSGADFVAAGTGSDRIWGDEGADRLFGGGGGDEMHGGAGDDLLTGETGEDQLYGDEGDDLLVGGLGDDGLFGGEGDDTANWQLGDGVDSFDGDEGVDQLSMLGYVLDQDAFYNDPDNYVVDDGLVDTIVVSASSLDDDAGNKSAEIVWTHGADPTFSIVTGEVESLKLDAGRGADDFLINDLQSTSVDSMRVSSGQNQGIVEEVNIQRDEIGRAVGQDLLIEGSVGQEFRLKVGTYGRASAIITLADDGTGNVDRQATAIDIQAALQALLGDDSIDVTFDPDVGRYKVAGLMDAADRILVSDAAVGVFSSSLQRLSLNGQAGEKFSVRFGAAGLSTGLVEFAIDENGEVDELVTGAVLGDALRTLTGDDAIEVVYDADSATYVVAGMAVGSEAIELDTSLSDAGVTLTTEIVQELDVEGLGGQVFELRFGADGETSGPVTIGDDGSGNVDTAATAASVESALHSLAGYESLTVTYDNATGVYVVSGFTTGAASLEVVEDADAVPVSADSSSTQMLSLTGTAGSLFRLQFGDAGLATDFISLAIAAGGGVDEDATASAIQAALRTLFEGPEAVVGYDADAGKYIVTGLDGATGALQVSSGGITTDVVGSATVIRDMALTGEAGQQFRVQMGPAGELSGIVTLVGDGNGAIDAEATALSLQSALRQLGGSATVVVAYDADQGLYRVTGLEAPDNALQIDSEGLVSDVTVASRPGGIVFKVFDVGGDQEIDSILIRGSEGADVYRVSTIEAIGVDGKGATSLRYEQLNGGVSATGQLLSHVVVDVFGLETADSIRLDALDGNDHVDATAVTTAVVADLIIDGGAGNDRLIGSNQGSISDVLVGGIGSDTITGGAGVDRFFELAAGQAGNLAGDIDTLIETRDADFELSNTRLGIDDSILHNQYGNEVETFDDIFEDVRLSGLDGANKFTISGWSDSGVLDGAKGGDTYILELARTGAGRQFFNIDDTGASGIDSLTYKGSSGNDTIQLDTVYNPDEDDQAVPAFTDPRWLEYGRHGDGLIIGHFNADSSDFEIQDITDEDRLMDVSVSSLTAGDDYQVVNYDTVEEVVVFGGEGNDSFISDDTGARFNVFGNAGDDQFYVGSVLEVEDVIVEGQIVTVVKQITRGVSFNDTSFYGGDGDDYFEVNRNAADINLYGDNGDDVFLVKALLTEQGGELVEVDSRTATVSGTFGEDSEIGGVDTSNDTREVDIDTLVYVENANVSIDGGAGFDAVSLVGTVLSDTFYVFVETDPETGDSVQRIYGAGVKLQQLLNIEQIQLLTGRGDDTVYLYGVDMGTIGDMLIRTGSGSDTVIVGGPEQTITQIFPRSSEQFFSTVEGYDVEKDATGRFKRVGEVDGLPFYAVRELTRIVPFEVESPGRSENIIMPAAYDIDAFMSPVVIDAGTGLNDEITFNYKQGTARVNLEDGVLTKKDLVFDTARIDVVSETNDPASDLPAILLATAGETGDEARGLLSAVVTDYIRFADRYYEPGLLEGLAALSGTGTQVVVVPEGVSYFTIETTLVDDVVVTAREQLIQFAGDFGLDLSWKEVAHPDPTRAAAGEKLYELLAIFKDGASIAFEALHTETIVFDNNERSVVKDLSGLTLKTVAPLRATLSAGVVTRSVEVALSGSVGQEFRLNAAGASSAAISLVPDAAGDIDAVATAASIQAQLRALTGSDLVSVRATDAGIFRVTGLSPDFVDLQIDTTGLVTDVSGTVTEIDSVEPVRVEAVNTMTGDGEDARIYFYGFDSLDIQLSEASAAGSELHIDNDLFTGNLSVQGGSETDRIYIENVATDTVVHGNEGDDVITVGRAGLLDDVGAQLYLFGDEGDDEIVVEGSADSDGANVGIDKNVLQRTSSFEQLSRVTDALGLKGVTSAENALLEDRLKEAALPFGLEALDVDASDLTAYRDYAAEALLAELDSIVSDLDGQLTAELDEAVALLKDRDQALLENQIKLYVRTRYYETIDIDSAILNHLSSQNGVETYIKYEDYDPDFYFTYKKVKTFLGTITIPIPQVRWVLDKFDSGKVTRDWDIEGGLAEIERFFRNPDAAFKSYGLAGVANDNLSKKYLDDIKDILNDNSLFSLISSSYYSKDKLKFLGGGKLDDDEFMRIYLKTTDVNSEFKRANSFALAKIYDEARAKYDGSASVYANLLGQRGFDSTDLNALYNQYKDNDQVRGFVWDETNFSKSQMIVSAGDFDIEIDAQYRILADAVQAKVDHLEGNYRTTYLNKIDELKNLIATARANSDYSSATLQAITDGVAGLKTFLNPLTANVVDNAAGGEGSLIKAQAYNLFATTTGNGIAGQIGQLAALSDTIEATDFSAITTVGDSAGFTELTATFNGSDYQAVREAYRQAGEVIASFSAFNARYLGGNEAPA